jgi:hypothetical protein
VVTAVPKAAEPSKTNQSLTDDRDSALPVSGPLSAKIGCSKLAEQDFSKIPYAETKIASATLVTASPNGTNLQDYWNYRS